MHSAAAETQDAAAWDIARPARPGVLPGVRMAGFRARCTAPVDLRVIPHPAVMLALAFGSGSPFVDDAAAYRQHRGSFVAGLAAGGHGELRLRGQNIAGVQVRLSPLLVRAALGVSPAELDGAVVTLDDMWGRDASRLREQLDDATSWADRFALTQALLRRRCDAGPAADPEVVWAWQRIVASRGRVRIEGLAADLGWSRKRLWSRFQAQVGLPPKRAARLVRFDRAVHHLAAGADVAFVAAEGGFADQSHLHRDVVELAGVTPAHVGAEPWLAVDDVAWPTGTFFQDMA